MSKDNGVQKYIPVKIISFTILRVIEKRKTIDDIKPILNKQGLFRVQL